MQLMRFEPDFSMGELKIVIDDYAFEGREYIGKNRI